MLLWIAFGTLAVGIVSIYVTLKSMRPIDAASLVFRCMKKSGLLTLMTKTGMVERMRPEEIEVTAPNGLKLITPSSSFWMALEPVLTFKTRPDDIFVATYPKAGTTWIQEITWLICNDANIAAAKKESVTARSPFLESIDVDENLKGLQSLEKWPMGKQRIIKTHFPYELLPEEVTKEKKSKIVVVTRNPKDLCVSYFHFHRMLSAMPRPGTWEEFLTRFSAGKVGPGSWFSHTLKYWEEYQADNDRIYFTSYESLKKDLRSEVASLAKFLERDLTEEQIAAIAEHCTFDSMSKNKKTNYNHAEKVGMDFKKSKFMRKGEVGDWKNYFTLNQNEAFDELYEAKMKGTGLTFSFEL